MSVELYNYYMGVKEDIKILLVKENLSIKDLAERVSKISGKKYSIDGLYKKLNNGTMKYDEVQFLAGVLGYEIEFKKVK